MFYSSRYSRKHVFHYADCRYSKRTKEENKISFRSFGEAINAGCVPCAYCNLINGQYEADQKAIDAFCEELSAFVNSLETWRKMLEDFRPAAAEAKAASDAQPNAQELSMSGFMQV